MVSAINRITKIAQLTTKIDTKIFHTTVVMNSRRGLNAFTAAFLNLINGKLTKPSSKGIKKLPKYFNAWVRCKILVTQLCFKRPDAVVSVLNFSAHKTRGRNIN